MKGVILAAGPGEALKPITDKIEKAMVMVMGKPLIYYAIERLAKNGITEIIIVVKDKSIEDYFGNGEDNGLYIRYVTQKGAGIDGAILSVSDEITSDDPFIVTHCDIISDASLLTRTLNASDNLGTEMAIAVALQSETQDFGVVRLDSEGAVEKVLTSTDNGEGNYVVAGTFVVTRKIFNYLQDGIPFNKCFNNMIESGEQVAAGIWTEDWIDVGHPWDLLRASRFLLRRMSQTEVASSAVIEHNVEISGIVKVEEGAQILNGAIIKGPVYIGKNAFIGNNCLIRDRTVIADNAKIGMGVEVRSSIIMENASIARLSYIGSSVVGPSATIHSGAITIITRKPEKPIKIEIQGEEVEVPLDKFGSIIGPDSHVGEHTCLDPGTIVDTGVIIKPNTSIKGRISK